jgi:hypothetical protein
LVVIMPVGFSRKILSLLLSAALLPLAGCSGTWYVRGSCESDGTNQTCKVEGGAEGRFIVEKSTGNDFSSLTIDFSGTSIDLPSQGGLTLIATDSATGAALSSGVFTWARSGPVATLVDPSAVNAWAGSLIGQDVRIDFELDEFTSTALPGPQVLAVSLNVGGTSQASFVQSWYHSPPCQFHCDEK